MYLLEMYKRETWCPGRYDFNINLTPQYQVLAFGPEMEPPMSYAISQQSNVMTTHISEVYYLDQ